MEEPPAKKAKTDGDDPILHFKRDEKRKWLILCHCGVNRDASLFDEEPAPYGEDEMVDALEKHVRPFYEKCGVGSCETKVEIDANNAHNRCITQSTTGCFFPVCKVHAGFACERCTNRGYLVCSSRFGCSKYWHPVEDPSRMVKLCSFGEHPFCLDCQRDSETKPRCKVCEVAPPSPAYKCFSCGSTNSKEIPVMYTCECCAAFICPYCVGKGKNSDGLCDKCSAKGLKRCIRCKQFETALNSEGVCDICGSDV